MKVKPFEVYQHYLSLKNHFTNPKYDFFKYGAKTRASVTSFNKRRDKYWFEKTSRKYNDEEVVKFLVSNFSAASNPQNLGIGSIINNIFGMDKKTTEFDLLIQRTKQRIALEQRIRKCIQLFERTPDSVKKISWWRRKS
jgi:uncharacterized membrane protein